MKCMYNCINTLSSSIRPVVGTCPCIPCPLFLRACLRLHQEHCHWRVPVDADTGNGNGEPPGCRPSSTVLVTKASGNHRVCVQVTDGSQRPTWLMSTFIGDDVDAQRTAVRHDFDVKRSLRTQKDCTTRRHDECRADCQVVVFPSPKSRLCAGM